MSFRLTRSTGNYRNVRYLERGVQILPSKMAKCDICEKTITKKSPGLECNKCQKIVHGNQSCSGLSVKQLSALRNAESLEWTCEECCKDSPRRKSLITPDDDDDDQDDDNDVNITSPALKKLLGDISKEVKKAVKNELAPVNDSINNCCQKMDEMMRTMESFKAKIKELEKKNVHLQNQNTHLELKVEALEQHLHNVEQKLINNVLEITGIPENNNEHLDTMLTQIINKLNTSKEEVSTVKRLKGRKGKEGIIQITLAQEEQVHRWIRAARTQTICVEDVVSGAGPEHAKSRVMFRRALTNSNKSLLWQAKQKLRDSHKYVWFQEGNILARKSDNDKPSIIRNIADIDKILTTTTSTRRNDKR